MPTRLSTAACCRRGRQTWRVPGTLRPGPNHLWSSVPAMDTNPAFTAADLAYIEEAYRPLEDLCAERGRDPAEAEALVERGLLPRPPYTLPDGRRMAPPDEF